MKLSPPEWVEMAYDVLDRYFGDLKWWPAVCPLEVMVGAVLTQNTAWGNVEKAVDALRRKGYLSVQVLSELPEEELADLIKASGFYRVKAKRLKALIRFMVEQYSGDVTAMFTSEGNLLRQKLLGVHGIGEETADSILLYAGEKPFFVVDAYTRRILARHHVVDENAPYGAIQSLFIRHLPPQVSLYNQYHALLVETGKRFCRRHPRCVECPLNALWCGDDKTPDLHYK